MADEVSRTCAECQGAMSPVIIMDKTHPWPTTHRHADALEYRLPEDQLSFWTGKYATAGPVRAFLCAGCGRIALYGGTGPSPEGAG